MSHAYKRLTLLALLALLAVFEPAARLALATAFTVTSLADSGPGTLRQAIIDANASAGADTITFSSAGTITLQTPLPALTDGSITIDGTIPAGGTTPQIELRGSGSVAGSGILIHSSGNTIRGLIINGFIKESLGTGPDWGGAGVTISGSATNGVASGNTVEYNYIGTNTAGSAPGDVQFGNNEMAGVLLIVGASGNTISHNVISGNQGPGVYLTRDHNLTDTSIKDGNVIRDNIIGLNASASAALPNISHGVWVGNNSQNTAIGPGNVISGNGKGAPDVNSPVYGVQVNYDGGIGLSNGVFYPRGTTIKGNKIGTNPAGTAALPNRDGGVRVSVSTNTTVGGASAADPAERNLISGNNTVGVLLEDYQLDATPRTLGAVVQNNWIGPSAAGTAAIPNTTTGVLLRGNVGGARVGPGNVISGNGDPVSHAGGVGVQVLVTSTEVGAGRIANTNAITGNQVGLTPDGLAFLQNQDYGVQLKGPTFGNTIGNNRVTGNQSAGVDLRANTGTAAPHDNTLSGNQIGLLGNNTAAGNGPIGVQLNAGSTANTIGPNNVVSGHTGGGAAGILLDGAGTSGNTIAGDNVVGNEIGIHVTNNATGNTITRTTTDANAGKGILLDNGGNAAIDPNRLTVVAPAQGFILTGSATGCNIGNGCVVEVFDDDNPLVDEGPHFLTSFPTAGTFNVSIAGCKHYLIFTLTDPNGNTSEFIKPTGNLAQCVASAPGVSIATDPPAPPRSVVPGASTTYTHHVQNTGTGPGAVGVNFTTNNNWATLSGNTCTGTLNAGATCDFSVVVSVPANAQATDFNESTIAVSVGAASAQQVDRTDVLVNPALEFTPDTQTKTTSGSQPLSFQHTLTNRGGAPDTFAITATVPLGWEYSVAPAGPIALAKDAAISVTVTITPAAGLATGTYTSTVRASSISDPSVFEEATDIAEIAGAAAPQIASVVTPSQVAAGGAVTITYTIGNTGNQSGTIDLAFTPPPGWAVTQAVTPSVTLDPGATAEVSATLQAPANAIAGLYLARLVATARDTTAASAAKVDQIVVAGSASLSLTPASQTTADRPPNAVYTDTVTLTNNGNFTDTVTLSASSNQGWSVRPISTSVTLEPGASQAIGIERAIPPGAPAGTVDTTTVTATSSLPAFPPATAQITTTVAPMPGGTFAPALLDEAVVAGQPMTFTFTLLNSGSISQTFTLTTTGVPQGWTSSLEPLSTPALDPGQTASVQLVLQAPADTPTGTTADVTIAATSDQAPFPVAQATARLRIGATIDAELGGACTSEALPGAIVRCAHTIKNIGLTDTTFSISAVSSLGWESQVAPPSLFLKAGATATFTVTVLVPVPADGGAKHMLFVSAKSSGTGEVASQVADTITVIKVAGASFAPDQTGLGQPTQQVQFHFTLVNTGNSPDTFAITATQDLDWPIAIVPAQTPVLQRGESYTAVAVTVTVPVDAAPKAINHIVVRATSQLDPQQFAETFNTVKVDSRGAFYIPMIMR